MSKLSLLLFVMSSFCTSSLFADVILRFDFSGAQNTVAFNTQASTFNDPLINASSMTRGAGISTNNASNSFRGTGFSNDSISVGNTDYFQFSVTALPGNLVTIESLTGNFNGTSSFSSSPGVTMNWAYSLDGSTYTLSSTNFTRIGAGVSTYTFGGTDATALTNVSSVTFRLFAQGQTTTGGWGLQSGATVGTDGLIVNGITAVPEPSSMALLSLVGLGGVVVRRFRKGRVG